MLSSCLIPRDRTFIGALTAKQSSRAAITDSARTNSRHSSRLGQGFTLVEVIISLAVLSMIVLAATTALRSFAKVQSTIQHHVERLENMRMGIEFIRESVAGAVPVARSGGLQTYFGGEKNHLIWVAPLSRIGAAGMQVMRLSVTDDESENLILQIAPYINPLTRPDWASLDKHIISGPNVELEFGYRGYLNQPWGDAWPFTLASPSSVRLNITVGERYWPELIVNVGSTHREGF